MKNFKKRAFFLIFLGSLLGSVSIQSMDSTRSLENEKIIAVFKDLPLELRRYILSLLSSLNFNFQCSKTLANIECYAVALSPDGSLMATGTKNAIQLRDAITGDIVKELKVPGEGLMPSIAFSSDGDTILWGGNDKTALLVSAETGTILHELKGHENAITFVAFSKDGCFAATGSKDKTARVWDVKTGQQVWMFKYPNKIMSLEFSFDGKMLLTFTTECRAYLRSVETYPKIAEDLTFRNDCTVAALFTFNENTIFWNTHVGEAIIKEASQEKESIMRAAFSPDGSFLASTTVGLVTLWDAKTGERLCDLDHMNESWGKSYFVTSLSLSNNGLRLCSCTGQGVLKLWLRCWTTEKGTLEDKEHAFNLFKLLYKLVTPNIENESKGEL